MRLLLFSLLFFLAACNFHESRLISAVRTGDAAAVRSLVRGGANPNHAEGVNDWPALLHAVHKNQLGTAAALLDAGAGVNVRDPRGQTALMMAAGYGSNDMVELLLQRGGDPRLIDRAGSNALDYAMMGVAGIDKFTLFECQKSTAALLLRADADLGVRTATSVWARFKSCLGHA